MFIWFFLAISKKGEQDHLGSAVPGVPVMDRLQELYSSSLQGVMLDCTFSSEAFPEIAFEVLPQAVKDSVRAISVNRTSSLFIGYVSPILLSGVFHLIDAHF